MALRRVVLQKKTKKVGNKKLNKIFKFKIEQFGMCTDRRTDAGMVGWMDGSMQDYKTERTDVSNSCCLNVAYCRGRWRDCFSFNFILFLLLFLIV